MAPFDRITSASTILNGQPAIRGKRLTVRRVIEALAIWPDWDDPRREYPELEPNDIRQALAFAVRAFDKTCQPRLRGSRASFARQPKSSPMN